MKIKLFTTLFCLLWVTQHAIAQNTLRIVGDAKFLPGELIDKSIKDVNGQVVAGIRIKPI